MGQNSKFNTENTSGEKERLKDPSVLTLTIIGTLIVLLAFYILYRSERVTNKQWIVKSAKSIDPNKPGKISGIVKFTGTPRGDLVFDDLTGEHLVYLRRSLYHYKKVKKKKTETSIIDGRKKLITKTVYVNDWVYITGDTKLAEDLTIGEINIRLKEAEVIGKDDWRKSLYITGTGKSFRPPEIPSPGDKRFDISGVNARNPIFAVGNLSDKFLGSGKLFIISAYSEGKTIEELEEFFLWRWMRHPICFVILFIGLMFLIHPAMMMLKKFNDVPVLGVLSNAGWILFIFISFILSLLIVIFSSITVDLIWLILFVIVIAPIIIYFKNKTGQNE